MDWHAWHDDYDKPGTPLARRLTAVQDQIRVALDAAPPGPLHAISLCAGQGRDLIGVLARHPRRDDVTARLVEIDPRNAAAAREAAEAAGLPGVEVVTADAALTDQYAGMTPSYLVLACGMFGHLTDDDVRRMIGFCTQLCAHGGTVIWTRQRREPDLVPRIRDWFAEDGFEPVWVSDPARGWGVGAHRFTANPVPLQRGARMFRFTRRPPTLISFRTGRARAPPPYLGSPGPSARPGPCARSATHAAIWLRELKPSLAMMFATCLAAVVWLMESSAAMALLDRPPATSSAISCSRWVSELGGAAATR